ncbi:PC-esterase domain-containing protein 1A-like isoform X1 [Synchiropus splendidus]|uniref:PC-esterase domain-containing protein 1A-like isoform X1 n=2 Tax=Synchiropus splendidus TaxID=270530 RepID=UPI00237E2739|nr:PC-esterase domain-containing protein 1A-like isoform X1 [Synchiropus splendidus]
MDAVEEAVVMMGDMRCCVSHQQTRQLLHNKFVVVLGDSNLRAVYKDLVLLLQKDKYLTQTQLKTKGETTFEQDRLIEGGCLSPLHNGTSYREVRQFQSPHHLVRFYFVTRVYSSYMRSILEDFRRGTKPDLVIINSCLWDISRYGRDWVSQYKRDLSQFFQHIDGVLPDEALVIWTQTMPLAEQIRGGFLVPEISHRAPAMSHNVIEANFYSATLADAYDMDVLDLHFLFRFSLRHRAKDGIHWNAIVHRRISSMLMLHVAQAWGVSLSDPVIPPPAFGSHHQVQPLAGGLTGESLTNLSAPATRRPPARTPPQHQRLFTYPKGSNRHDTCVMRRRRRRRHYNPYADQRRPGGSYCAV